MLWFYPLIDRFAYLGPSRRGAFLVLYMFLVLFLLLLLLLVKISAYKSVPPNDSQDYNMSYVDCIILARLLCNATESSPNTGLHHALFPQLGHVVAQFHKDD